MLRARHRAGRFGSVADDTSPRRYCRGLWIAKRCRRCTLIFPRQRDAQHSLHDGPQSPHLGSSSPKSSVADDAFDRLRLRRRRASVRPSLLRSCRHWSALSSVFPADHRIEVAPSIPPQGGGESFLFPHQLDGEDPQHSGDSSSAAGCRWQYRRAGLRPTGGGSDGIVVAGPRRCTDRIDDHPVILVVSVLVIDLLAARG